MRVHIVPKLNVQPITEETGKIRSFGYGEEKKNVTIISMLYQKQNHT